MSLISETMPHDSDAETAVLSCCLQSKTAREKARQALSRADFWSVIHEQVWVAMEEMDASSRPIDATTLADATRGILNVAPRLAEIVTCGAVPDRIEHYADIVRKCAVRRRMLDEAARIRQDALSPEVDPYGLATTTINRLTEIRDTGLTGDVHTRLMADLLEDKDLDHWDWAVPGLLERRDRLVLTGEEGLGKSYLGRQLGIFAAAGMHPFGLSEIEPQRVQILDYENSWSQIRRASRKLWAFANEHGYADPSPNLHVASLGRIDITRDKDLSRIHREVDVANPDVIIVGPLYKLVPRSIQTDDEAAPVLAALDTLRDRGCSLVIEAHAGHTREPGEKGQPGSRDLRPRGSSALLGWPEFGYGMRGTADGGVKMVRWRGDRSERAWPNHMRRARHDASYYVPDPEADVA